MRGFQEVFNSFGESGTQHANVAYRHKKGTATMRWVIALAATFLSVSANAKDDPIANQVVADLYFLSAQCDKYLEGVTEQERQTLTESANLVEKNEALRFVAGQDSIISDFQRLFKANKLNFNANLTQLQEKAKPAAKLVESYEDENYSQALLNEAIANWTTIAKSKTRTKMQRDEVTKFVWCRIAAVSAGMGINAAYPKKYVEFALSRKRSATIGYFEVATDGAQYGATVGTGNRFSEPKTWAGSRFFIVNASFKNLDTESRLPLEGSLFIKYEGKEYEYDSTEPIMLEGYNIWFRKINPLITMKTKIVYRIPNEIHGEVFWRPGRNAEDTRLWLGFIKPVEN